jgi:hypothetical protein
MLFKSGVVKWRAFILQAKVQEELDVLNVKLEDFNSKLESIGNDDAGPDQFKVPKLQKKLVTKWTEEAFSRVEVANKFIIHLRSKLDLAEEILNVSNIVFIRNEPC